MTERIVIAEYENLRIDLSDDDLALFSGSLRDAFSIQRAWSGDGYVINPGATVGVVRLPSGPQIEIRPKVPLGNLLWMLAVAERWHDIERRLLDDQVMLRTFDDILEIIAGVFADMVERRLDLGLYRNYIEVEDNLPTIRGRILFGQDIALNAMQRHRTFCQYTTWSWDIPENQVIRQVVRQLAGWGFRPRLTARFLALDRQMDEITPSRMHAADIDRFTYNRQSVDYREIHRYCRFFLEHASLSEHAGDVGFDGFLINMNTLFEAFVTESLRTYFPPPYRIAGQVRETLDTDGCVAIRPDLVLSRFRIPVLIGDCKYKQLGATDHKHSDLYQVLAYCTSLDVPSGVLIYPCHNVDRADRIAIRNSPIHIREISIDLGGDVVSVRREFALLAARLIGWSKPAAWVWQGASA